MGFRRMGDPPTSTNPLTSTTASGRATRSARFRRMGDPLTSTDALAFSPCPRKSRKGYERAQAANRYLSSKAQNGIRNHADHLLRNLAQKRDKNNRTHRSRSSQSNVKRRRNPQIPDSQHERSCYPQINGRDERLVKRDRESERAEAHEQRQVRSCNPSKTLEKHRGEYEQKRNEYTTGMIGIPRHLERRIRQGRLEKHSPVPDEVHPHAHRDQPDKNRSPMFATVGRQFQKGTYRESHSSSSIRVLSFRSKTHDKRISNAMHHPFQMIVGGK